MAMDREAVVEALATELHPPRDLSLGWMTENAALAGPAAERIPEGLQGEDAGGMNEICGLAAILAP
jgi:hypothetical protein